MKMKKIYSKNIALLSLVGVLSLSLKGEDEFRPLYKILPNDCLAFGRYSNGLVYIGSLEYLNNIENIDLENDVLIEDLRNNKDPNMKIINSYAIDNKRQMKEIINLLEIYEEMNPSPWDRSVESMYKEWICHNILYSINYKKESTTDVDLNNEDEEFYKKLVFKLIN